MPSASDIKYMGPHNYEGIPRGKPRESEYSKALIWAMNRKNDQIKAMSYLVANIRYKDMQKEKKEKK
jgi:hypothetical protein